MQELLSTVWTHLSTAQIVKGEGIYLYDDKGNRYIDFTSGIGVLNTGHCHPRITKAVQQQAGELLFGQMNCVVPDATVKLAQKLDEITPPYINRFFFSNSGAEATEACVKLAKAATGRSNIIVFQGSFHGRTHLAMAMTTSKTVYRQKFQPLPSGIFVTPFPYAYQYGWSENEAVAFCKKQLDILLRGQTAPNETAAIIIEPVLGEGGYVPAPAPFLQHLRDVCDEHGILLVMDEVQSGFGRTVTMFCFEQSDIKPDIIVMAKGLGSGLPISAIASSREIMERWLPGTHGGTYGGGSAVASRAAAETIDVIRDENLSENAADRGSQLMDALQKLQAEYPIIGDVRGRGLMVATEFTDSNGNPDAETTKKVAAACIKNNLLLLTCGTYGNVIRWIPPLIVTNTQLDETLSVFKSALQVH
ncbi:MAG: aminotransferase class III-fold pyridoxal phosphate-dependent enzyme [Balneolaceae bacterium]|nr:aminotransferase class III-fold pyridoxal phosphate-dependent enzyme [Balneolaceae bacterium]